MKWLLLLGLVGCVHGAASTVPSYSGMGPVHRKIVTSSPVAQQHFDAGLALLYGFNDDEAIYELLVAQHADPACAMCAWGLAYAAGPNINAFDKQFPGAFDAAVRAESMAKAPVEKALAHALVARMAPTGMADFEARKKLHAAYLAEMRKVAALAPYDTDVGALLAEAMLMVAPPFTPNYDRSGKTLFPIIDEAARVLERVLARSPDHIGAIHFYIHVVDGGRNMETAVPYAKRMAQLAPAAGHLVHMPSHLYLKLGRYAEAEDSNRAAMAADKSNLASTALAGNYEMFSMHPEMFLLTVLLWSGEQKAADEVTEILVEKQKKMSMMDPGAMDMAVAMQATTAARFGEWDTALTLEPSGPASNIAAGFAKGLALVATGKLDEAEKQITVIQTPIPDPSAAPQGPGGPATPPTGSTKPDDAHAKHAMPGMPMPGAQPAAASTGGGAPSLTEKDAKVDVADKKPEPPPMPMMGPPPLMIERRNAYMRAVAESLAAQLRGAIANARGDAEKSLAELRSAVELEDKVPDMGETSDVAIPARHRLGAALLATGKAAEAAEVYRADLKRHPHNGWALFGLAKALEALKHPKAAAAMDEFRAAWKRADIELTSSVR